MKKNIRIHDVIMIAFTIGIMIMTLIQATYTFIGFSYNPWMYAAIIILLYTFLYLAGRYKFLWLLLLTIFFTNTPRKIMTEVISFKNNLMYFINSLMLNQYIIPKYRGYFSILLILSVIILGTIFYYITIKISPYPFVIFGIGIIASFYYYDNNNAAYNYCFIFLIESVFLIGCCNISKRNRKSEIVGIKQEKNYKLKWTFSMMIFIIILSAVSFMLPNNFINHDNMFLTRLFETRGSKVSNGSSSGKFGVYKTGYQSESQVLGGSVQINHKLALKIQTEDDITGTHLRGSIKDEYDGKLWRSSNKSTRSISGGNVEKYFLSLDKKDQLRKSIHITSYTDTSNIFVPLYPVNVYSKNSILNIDSNDEISSKKQVYDYAIDYKDVNITKNDLINIAKYKSNNSENDKYLQVSSTIPKRVYDLTNSLVNKYESPVLKAIAIQNYLKDKYPYSFETSTLPEKRDFVDYFLFDEKKGSCTYYASAMAVMCRIAGIPSRYVEGFIVESSNHDRNGFINVDNSCAHAWVELYFNGAGWITFDPTPGFSSAFDENEAATGENTVKPNENVTEKQQGNSSDSKSKNENNESQQKITRKSKGNTYYQIPYIYAVVLVIMVISIIIVYVHFNSKKNIEKYEYVILLYGKYCGVKYKHGETFREYCERFEKVTNISMKKLIEIYEKYLYGNGKLNDADIEEIEYKILEIKRFSLKGNKKIYIPLKYIFDQLYMNFKFSMDKRYH